MRIGPCEACVTWADDAFTSVRTPRLERGPSEATLHWGRLEAIVSWRARTARDAGAEARAPETEAPPQAQRRRRDLAA